MLLCMYRSFISPMDAMVALIMSLIVKEKQLKRGTRGAKKNEDDETRRMIDEESYVVPADGREDEGRDQGNP